MICVTGASGTLGSEIVKRLESARMPFRGGYFTKKKAEAARARGINTVIIDYNRPATLQTAFQGCDKLFLLGPNVMNQSKLEQNAIEVAKEVDVRHIVKLSVMGAIEESFSLAKIHRPVEKAIESSGLAWTFIRPNSFMQNVVTYMGQTIRTESALYSASGQAKISHVDVRDIAEVSVLALIEPYFEGKTCTLSGPEALSYDELASELSKTLGRSISHINLSPSDMKNGMLAEGMVEPLADRMLDLERYFREGQAGRITNDIKQLTGREPRQFAEYIHETAATGVWDAAKVTK